MRYKGILLDIDNTLYDYNKTHTIALDSLISSANALLHINRIDLAHAYLEARNQISRQLCGTASSHNRLLYIQTMLESLDVSGLDVSLKLYEIYWNTFLENIEVYDGVYAFLESIKEIPLCLVTDLTAHIQHRKIKKLRLDHYADYLITSEEAGHDKPHPYIFLSALYKMDLKPNEVCMIGDNFKKDILGATHLKIASFWLHKGDTTEEINSELTITFSEFDELKEHIL
jgi:putative hydrolase of the HAD superfamily